MARYIDADALIEAIRNELWDWCSVYGITSAAVLKQTITDIQNVPTAEVVERKRGKWKDFTMGSWVCAQCSVCGTVHDTKTKFCPNCGAQMDSE